MKSSKERIRVITGKRALDSRLEGGRTGMREHCLLSEATLWFHSPWCLSMPDQHDVFPAHGFGYLSFPWSEIWPPSLWGSLEDAPNWVLCLIILAYSQSAMTIQSGFSIAVTDRQKLYFINQKFSWTHHRKWSPKWCQLSDVIRIRKTGVVLRHNGGGLPQIAHLISLSTEP